MRTLKAIVIGILIYFMANVALGWVTWWVKGSIPETLVQGILDSGTAELVLTAVIEIFKPLIEAIVKKIIAKVEGENGRNNITDNGAGSETCGDLDVIDLDDSAGETVAEDKAD